MEEKKFTRWLKEFKPGESVTLKNGTRIENRSKKYSTKLTIETPIEAEKETPCPQKETQNK